MKQWLLDKLEWFKSTQVQIFFTFFFTATAISLTTAANGEAGIIDDGRALITSVLFASSIIYARIMAYADSKVQIRGIHWSRAIFRGLLMAFLPFILFIQATLSIPLIGYISLALVQYSTFYLIFELSYNHYRDFPPFYVGRQALTDRIVRWINEETPLSRIWPLWFLLVKLALIGTSVYLSFKYYISY